MPNTDLQFLFEEPIVSVGTLDPGYSGHASDVWCVRTVTREVIVRCSRLMNEPAYEFWWGCKFLFGIDPRHMGYFVQNARILSQIPDIRVPKVIAIEKANDKEYILVEKMPGTDPKTFTGQSEPILRQLGRWLANVHLMRLNYFGNVAQTKVGNTNDFHQELALAMKILVDREHEPTSKIGRHLDLALSELTQLPLPEYFCPVFVDMRPSQFLTNGRELTAVVDIEGYVVGPRELDFIGLEYILDEGALRPFVRGYAEILELPDLSRCRHVYRYLYRLLGVHGSVDLDEWFSQPALF